MTKCFCEKVFFHTMREQSWFTTLELKQMSQFVFPLREPHFPFERHTRKKG